jgi:hypothetical protein
MARVFTLTVTGLLTSVAALAANFAVGAAPKGDATVVASRIIKYNFPACKQVTSAVRQPDGSIRAACDRTQYLVFTVFNAKEGKLIELAMNCSAAKQIGVNC